MDRTNALCQKLTTFWTSYWRLALIFVIMGVVVNVVSISVFLTSLNQSKGSHFTLFLSLIEIYFWFLQKTTDNVTTIKIKLTPGPVTICSQYRDCGQMSVADLSATEVNSTADDTMLQLTLVSSKTETLSNGSLSTNQTVNGTKRVLIIYSSINGYPSFESKLYSNYKTA